MWCESCKEAWNQREKEAESSRAERVMCNMYRGKDTVIKEKVERNKKGEVFCLLYRTGKKVLWQSWGGKLEQSVPRTQKGRAGITDLEKVVRTVNQKAVQRREAREVR